MRRRSSAQQGHLQQLKRKRRLWTAPGNLFARLDSYLILSWRWVSKTFP